VASFESVVEEYDAARHAYPEGVYDALGELGGRLVLDVGAGTGIATRQLRSRGAVAIAVDRGPLVLTRARVRSPGLMALLADGCVLPVREGTVDVICFAQAWHWLDASARVVEAHRVLREGGVWAAWWSHARADAEGWFRESWDRIEGSCAGAERGQRDIGWGAGVAASGLFSVKPRVTVPWTREVAVDTWMTDQASLSYVAALPPSERDLLLCDLRDIVHRGFPGGSMTVRYETWLWAADKI
jgi:SAM-dependent methyltransferase